MYEKCRYGRPFARYVDGQVGGPSAVRSQVVGPIADRRRRITSAPPALQHAPRVEVGSDDDFN